MDPVFIQFLSVIPGLNYFANFYREVIPDADKRTGKWMFMSSPDSPASIVLAYLFTVVFMGPFLIRYLKIPRVRELLVVYNSGVLALNLWLGISLTWHILGAGYRFSCQKVGKPVGHEHSIANLLWIFHCSKIVELSDTIFLVLKKKENQLTFLHLYHHSTIVAATWIGVKFAPGGSSAVIAMVNSWIHVFMYFYYEMMVLGVKSFRTYKKFVTIMQIVQFLATIVHCTTSLNMNCGYPKWILAWLLIYMISFLVLFVHFYVQTYWKPKGNCNNGHCIMIPLESDKIQMSNPDREKRVPSTYSDDEEPEAGMDKDSLKLNRLNGSIEGNADIVARKSENCDPEEVDCINCEENDSQYTLTDDDMTSDQSSDLENEDKDTIVKACSAAVSAVVASSTSARLSTEGNDTLVLN